MPNAFGVPAGMRLVVTCVAACPIAAGTSLVVPLINVECSVLEGNGTNPAELRKCVKGTADDFTALALTIDGVAVPNLTKFRVQSNVFTFTAVDGNSFGLRSGTTRSVADGYWALISPLSAGTHTVTFGGSYSAFTTSATYTLDVG
jgi:hypothetical protein